MEALQILFFTRNPRREKGVSAMETGTTQTGCTYREQGHECRKLTDPGSLLCPHHRLLTEHHEAEKEKRQAERKTRPTKKQAQKVTPYYLD
jgi:hypothetical protein